MTSQKSSSLSKKADPKQSMRELLALYPSGRRTLFQRYHLGGCSSCSFNLDETLDALCARSGGLDATVVLQELEQAHLEDEKLLIAPEALRHELYNPMQENLCLLDIRTREEFEAVHIPTSQLLTQELMQTMMARFPKENLIILIDHHGERSLDAAAYFAGHGFLNVKALRGGIDAYAETVDPSLPRYEVINS